MSLFSHIRPPRFAQPPPRPVFYFNVDFNPNHGPVEDQARTAILQVLIVRNYSQGELIMKARDSELAMTSEEQRNPTAQAWHAEIANTIKNTQAMATIERKARVMGETWSDMSEEQRNGWNLHDWVKDCVMRDGVDDLMDFA